MKVRVVTSKHAGISPGDEGEIEGQAFKGFAVRFEKVRGLNHAIAPAVVYLTRPEFEEIEDQPLRSELLRRTNSRRQNRPNTTDSKHSDGNKQHEGRRP